MILQDMTKMKFNQLSDPKSNLDTGRTCSVTADHNDLDVLKLRSGHDIDQRLRIVGSSGGLLQVIAISDTGDDQISLRFNKRTFQVGRMECISC